MIPVPVLNLNKRNFMKLENHILEKLKKHNSKSISICLMPALDNTTLKRLEKTFIVEKEPFGYVKFTIKEV